MFNKFWLYEILLFLLIPALLHCKRSEYPYCFQFTWIGPYTDKENISVLSCDSLREDATNVPCRKPLVATSNDAIPDTTHLWHHNRHKPNKYGCPMTPGLSCVKYTYIYNKGIQNITYMCAKVNATNGCYRQKYISGLNVEVCVCESRVNATPCNAAMARIATPTITSAHCLLQHAIKCVLFSVLLYVVAFVF